jgi:hypothetical protein
MLERALNRIVGDTFKRLVSEEEEEERRRRRYLQTTCGGKNYSFSPPSLDATHGGLKE